MVHGVPAVYRGSGLKRPRVFFLFFCFFFLTGKKAPGDKGAISLTLYGVSNWVAVASSRRASWAGQASWHAHVRRRERKVSLTGSNLNR